jgi:hypothetical protein
MAWNKRKDIKGRQFGKLTALAPYKATKQGWKWVCQCSCGNKSIHLIGHLMSGHSKSCGCSRLKFIRDLIKQAKYGRVCSSIEFAKSIIANGKKQQQLLPEDESFLY